MKSHLIWSSLLHAILHELTFCKNLQVFNRWWTRFLLIRDYRCQILKKEKRSKFSHISNEPGVLLMVLTGVIFVVVVCQNQMVNMMVKNEYSVKTKQKYKDKNKAEKKKDIIQILAPTQKSICGEIKQTDDKTCLKNNVASAEKREGAPVCPLLCCQKFDGCHFEWHWRVPLRWDATRSDRRKEEWKQIKRLLY